MSDGAILLTYIIVTVITMFVASLMMKKGS